MIEKTARITSGKEVTRPASWLNGVEGLHSIITRRKIRRGVFGSVANLEDAICRYIRDHNRQAKPFVWTKTAKTILEKLSRLPAHQMWRRTEPKQLNRPFMDRSSRSYRLPEACI